MNIEQTLFAAACFLLLCVAAAIRIWIRSARESRSLARYNTVTQSKIQIPPTLHPVFDPTRCIGSGACTRVCPQGDDVVGRIQERGVLIDPSMCIGHGRCAAECPMGAIRLVFGTAERGVDIPHLSSTFETNVPGMYITGELGGMGLIANAVRQAKEGMANIQAALTTEKTSRDDDETVDVAIVGAGPAGLTSALWAIEHGLSYRIFDKEPTVGGAILQYPRSKIIMTRPMYLPLMGEIRATTMSREQLMALFQKAISAHGIQLDAGVRIETIERNDDGTFSVHANGERLRARKIMLAIGRRGVPRKLGVSGEQASHVSYSIAEPDPFIGKSVLVVGGGDSAVETACMLAECDNTPVVLSYRGEALNRVKPQNREKFEAMVSTNRIRPLFLSQVIEIKEHHTLLRTNEREESVLADAVIIQIGGELPTALLHRFGVSIERHFGEETEQHRAAASEAELFQRIRLQHKDKGLQNFHQRSGDLAPWIKWTLRGIALAVLVTLFYMGRTYYLTPDALRRDNPDLRFFSASGPFGHWLGIVAAIFMGINLLYFARKELRILRAVGNIQTWMFFHQFSGILAATTVLLHTGLILYNSFALALYVSLGIVVATGIIGRYFFTMVPLDPRGRPLTHEALVDLSARMKNRYTELFGKLEGAIHVSRILDLGYRPGRPFIVLLFRLFTIWPYRSLQLARIFRQSGKEIPNKQERASFQRYSVEMARLHLQLEIAPRIRRVLRMWRSGHALLALMTVALVVVHVLVEIWVGYRP